MIIFFIYYPLNLPNRCLVVIARAIPTFFSHIICLTFVSRFYNLISGHQWSEGPGFNPRSRHTKEF